MKIKPGVNLQARTAALGSLHTMDSSGISTQGKGERTLARPPIRTYA
jgi:hypothetical protein